MTEDIPHDKLVKIIRSHEEKMASLQKQISENTAWIDTKRTNNDEVKKYQIIQDDGNDKPFTSHCEHWMHTGYDNRPVHENEDDWSNDTHKIKERLETVHDGDIRKVYIQENRDHKQLHIEFWDTNYIDECETDILKDYGYKIVGVTVENTYFGIRVRK